jgi:transposase
MTWDSLVAHRKAESFLHEIGCPWVRFHRLPPYAPERPPVEHVWCTAKWGRLANAPSVDLDSMRSSVQNALDAQSGERRLLKAHVC